MNIQNYLSKIKEVFQKNNIAFNESGGDLVIQCPFCKYELATLSIKESGCECFNCAKQAGIDELFGKLGLDIKSIKINEEQKEKSKKNVQIKSEGKSRFVASEILPDGRIIEMVYKPEYRITQFAVFNGGEIEYLDKIELPHEIFLPYPATNHLISKKVIKFPSEAEEYGDDKALVQNIQKFIHRYLDISPFFEKIAAYYVVFTWIYDQFNELAYLRALGDYGSGKSRLLQVVGSLCYKPMFVGGATTTSPIFRIIDGFKGTLILDEADYRFSDTTVEIIKILNSGYQKGSPILRSEGKGTYEVKSYDVFCPKIIGTRKHFYDSALESRFLIEEMEKKELREDIPINLPDSFEEETKNLRNQLLMWRFRNIGKTKLKPEDIDRTLEPRLNQIIMPLLSIINDPQAKIELKEFVKEYNDQLITDRGMSLESEILEALFNCFYAGYSEPTIKQISDTYNAGLDQKEKLNPRKIGGILNKQLKLKSRRTRDGYIISESENKARLLPLKRKFGILEEKVVSVNNVNVVNVPEEQKEEIIGKEIDTSNLF